MAAEEGPSSDPPPAKRPRGVVLPETPFLEDEIASDPRVLHAAFRAVFPRGDVQTFAHKAIVPIPLREALATGGGEPGSEVDSEPGSEPDSEPGSEPDSEPGNGTGFRNDDGSGERRVWILAAHKGMGKSKAIRASVRACSPAPTVLNLTFRRSLARGAAADFPDGAVYLDLPGVDAFDARRYPVLTILVNSLARVRVSASARYDVVILDEWVSILEMLGGTLIDGSQRIEILRVLLDAIHFARAVIVGDALLDAPSIRILGLCLSASPVGSHVTLQHYTFANHADHDYIAYGTEDAWTQALLRAIRERRRVVVPCMTKAQALRLHTLLVTKERVPESRILTYVAGGEHDLVHHMANLHQLWRNADIVIYSPVITAGCSFEERGHFDECFLYAFQGTASARSALQMTFRVRDLVSRRIHVWVARGRTGWADAFHASALADRLLARKRPGGVTGEAAPVSLVHPAPEPAAALACSSIASLSAHTRSMLAVHDAVMRAATERVIEAEQCFPLTFWRLVAQTGVRVCRAESFPAGGLTPEDQIALRKALTQRVATQLAAFREAGGVRPTRPWQASDLEAHGGVVWQDPEWSETRHEPPHPLAAQHDRIATEFDPAEWQAAYMSALVAGWTRESNEVSSSSRTELRDQAELLAASATMASGERWASVLCGFTSDDFLPMDRLASAAMKPLAVCASRVVFMTALMRLERDDVLDRLAVSAAFGWAVHRVMTGAEGIHATASVDILVCNADASIIFARRATMNAQELFARMDPETFLPRALPSFMDRARDFDPRMQLAARGHHSLSSVFAIRPIDPTLPPLHEGSWTHPLSMLQAFCTGATHALVFTAPDAQPIAVRCSPMEVESIREE
jgi:hypothetical protein